MPRTQDTGASSQVLYEFHELDLYSNDHKLNDYLNITNSRHETNWTTARASTNVSIYVTNEISLHSSRTRYISTYFTECAMIYSHVSLCMSRTRYLCACHERDTSRYVTGRAMIYLRVSRVTNEILLYIPQTRYLYIRHERDISQYITNEMSLINV